MGDDGGRGVGGCEREVEGSLPRWQGDCMMPLVQQRCEVSTKLVDIFDDASMY